MEYSDNPRKIYGKVEIVYSDADISKDLETTESGNSEISHPQEIYRGYATPTVRACTMDGNCTMDGSWFMIDDSCKCGWWSGSLSDGNGVFATPPFIELAFNDLLFLGKLKEIASSNSTLLILGLIIKGTER